MLDLLIVYVILFFIDAEFISGFSLIIILSCRFTCCY